MPDLFVANDNNQQPLPDPAKTAQAVQTARPFIQQEKPALFSNYLHYPMGVSFETQEHDETIVLFLRRDLITNIPWILATILLACLPFLLLFIRQISPTMLASFPPNFLLILKIFYYIVIATYALTNYMTWYYNSSLVTTKRVLDINFSDIIYKDVSGTKINLIQDVSFTQIGAIRSIFNYGDVLVQTAGSVDNFTFEAVPNPDKVVQAVESLIGKEESSVKP